MKSNRCSKAETAFFDCVVAVLISLLSFYIFFSYTLSRYRIVFPIMCILLIVMLYVFYNDRSLIIGTLDIAWLIAFASSAFGILYSLNQREAIEYVLFILVLIAIRNQLVGNQKFEKVIIGSFLLFSMTHVVATLLQYAYPQVISRFSSKILTEAAQKIATYQLKAGKYPGITGQVGANAFYITVFLSIVSSYVIVNRKWLYTPFVLIAYFALYLTTKRGFILSNVLALIVTMRIYSIINPSDRERSNTRNFRTRLHWKIVFIVFICLIALALIYAPKINSVLEVFLDERYDLFKTAINMFMGSPIIGKGTLSFSVLNDNNAHNIYLQLLSENGLIGFLTFTSAFFVSISLTIKQCKQELYETTQRGKLPAAFSLYFQIFFLMYGLTGNGLYDLFIIGAYFIVLSFINCKPTYTLKGNI